MSRFSEGKEEQGPWLQWGKVTLLETFLGDTATSAVHGEGAASTQWSSYAKESDKTNIKLLTRSDEIYSRPTKSMIFNVLASSYTTR